MENPFSILEVRLAKLEQATQEILKILKNQRNEDYDVARIPIRVKAAAKILSLSESTIRTKAWKREIPSIKRGKYLYFFEAELLNFLNEGKRKSNQQIRDEVDNVSNTFCKQKLSGKGEKIVA